MWITNKLGYDITLSGVTLYKNSQQEISSADATTLNKDAVFTAMITAGTGLVKTDSQPDVNPQYFVRALDAPITLDGMPTNPNGHPMVSPAQAFDIGKSEGGDADLEDNKTETINVSTYTDPVEITPTEGKDGMKKATVTLSNIPQIEANKAQTIDVSTYTEPVEVTPTSGKDGMAKATVTLSNIPNPILRPSVPSWYVDKNSLIPQDVMVVYYAVQLPNNVVEKDYCEGNGEYSIAEFFSEFGDVADCVCVASLGNDIAVYLTYTPNNEGQ